MAAALLLLSDSDEDSNSDEDSDSKFKPTVICKPIPPAIYIPINTMVKATSKAPLKATSKAPPKTARKPAKAKLTGGRASGSRNFGLDELHHMLDLLEDILPIGPDEWESVMQQHNQAYPLPGRDVYAIRRKYMTLQRKMIPTGDQTGKANQDCPWTEG